MYSTCTCTRWNVTHARKIQCTCMYCTLYIHDGMELHVLALAISTATVYSTALILLTMQAFKSITNYSVCCSVVYLHIRTNSSFSSNDYLTNKRLFT